MRKTDFDTREGSISFAGYGELLTVGDCSEILHQSEQTVRKLCRERELPSLRIGRRLYVPRAQLVEHIESMLKVGA